jgi:hypothetical protein
LKAKEFYKEKWFDDRALSSVIISKFEGNFEILDITEIAINLLNLKDFIEKKSLRLVDEFTMQNFEYYK